MNYNFENKVAIITGASSGIGLALTKAFLKKEVKVVGGARNVNSLKSLEKAYKSSFYALPFDVTKSFDIKKIVRFTLAKFKQIDILVNNAGTGLLKSVSDLTMKELDKVFKTNLYGLVELTKEVLPLFVKQRSGFFVNVASIAGKTPSIYNSAYTASKHAVVGFSDCLRREVKQFGINVLVVNPTFVDTDFFKKNPKYLETFGHHARLLGLTPPKKMAGEIIKAIERKKWDLTHPFLANLYSKLYALSPKLAELFA